MCCHTKVSLDFGDETCQIVTDFLRVMGVVAASCIMYFLFPKTIDSDRPVALLATQIRWWRRVRADIMGDLEPTESR